ncbi:MAG: hypothetical protein M3525_01335 [Acidobacteriota bacterium]|nr:hypothetical protein [Acidobacteriota bacterium]
MSIKVNSIPNISLSNVSDAETGEKTESANSNVTAKLETSSASNLFALNGQMRKLQLLRQFSTIEITNIKPIQGNFAPSANRLVGGDDDFLKETQRLIDSYRRQIKPKEIKGAQPVEGSKTSGHPRSKHGVMPEVQADVMNKPDRIFSGINKNGRYVDIYYKDGSAVITVQGDKGHVISAYGNITTKGKAKPYILETITNNPNYVEIKLEKLGSTNVVFRTKKGSTRKIFRPDCRKQTLRRRLTAAA